MTTTDSALDGRGLNLLRNAGLLFLLNAVAHGLTYALGGLAAPVLLAGAAIDLVLGAGLLRGFRALGCIGFVVALVGISVGVAGLADPAAGPDWGYGTILALDLLAAVMLFLYIWRR
ncbi:hypothetical protein HKCCE3408_14885 [Rhodobacterales bacterium HKCCE3408]|nr:hypothetical protein [Rhodobacterales bacterium HKCCE3408]